jgi:hypothetical protein
MRAWLVPRANPFQVSLSLNLITDGPGKTLGPPHSETTPNIYRLGKMPARLSWTQLGARLELNYTLGLDTRGFDKYSKPNDLELSYSLSSNTFGLRKTLGPAY